jgi:hypothetical protein
MKPVVNLTIFSLRSAISRSFLRMAKRYLYSCKTIDKLKATDTKVNKDYLHLLSHLS